MRSFLCALIIALIFIPIAQASTPWDTPHIEFAPTGAHPAGVPHTWTVHFTTGELDLVLSAGQRISATPSLPSGCAVQSPTHVSCTGMVFDGTLLPTLTVEAIYDGMVCQDVPISATASGAGQSATAESLVLPAFSTRCTYIPLVVR